MRGGGDGFKKEHLIVPDVEIRWQQNFLPEHRINQQALLLPRVAVLAEEVAWCPLVGRGARGQLCQCSSQVASQVGDVRPINSIADPGGQFATGHSVEEVVQNVPPIAVDLVE